MGHTVTPLDPGDVAASPHRYFRRLVLIINCMPSVLIFQQKNGSSNAFFGTISLQYKIRPAVKSTPAETVD